GMDHDDPGAQRERGDRSDGARRVVSLGPARHGHILQPELTAGEDLARAVVSDDDVAQLLTAALIEGIASDGGAGAGGRAEEVGGDVDPHRELPLFENGVAGGDASRALDDRGVHTAVDHAPGGVVIVAELDVAGDGGGVDIVDDEAGGGDEWAGGFE